MADDALSRREAAKLLGIHPDTVSRMVADGPLAHALVGQGGRGNALLFSRAAVEVFIAATRNGHSLDPAHERARKDKATADLGEFRLAVERNEYIRHEIALHTYRAVVVATRNRLLAMPDTLTASIAREYTLGGEAGAYGAIKAAVHEALTELGTGELEAICPGCDFDFLAALEETEDDDVCGAPTRSGGTCKNRASAGKPCHLHRGEK